MIIFHPSLMRLRELMVPSEVAAWLASRNHAYPDVTFILGHVVMTPQERAEYRDLVRDCSQSFGAGAAPGIVQTVFLYYDETWSVRIIGKLTQDERAEIVQLPPPSELVRANANTFLRKRPVDQPATAKAASYVPVRQDRFNPS